MFPGTQSPSEPDVSYDDDSRDEKVRDDLQKQVKALEMDVEEQVSRFIELEQEKNAELMDLRQQNQALEKQLEKMRKFLDVSILNFNNFFMGMLLATVLCCGF